MGWIDLKILIVEDIDYKAERVKECMYDHTVERAKSRNSALRLIVENKYDGIVLDMGLPIFDDGYGLDSKQGLFVLREMKRKKIDTPVVIYSTNLAYVYDTFEYKNVKDYITCDSSCSIKEPIENFLKSIKKSA